MHHVLQYLPHIYIKNTPWFYGKGGKQSCLGLYFKITLERFLIVVLTSIIEIH